MLYSTLADTLKGFCAIPSTLCKCDHSRKIGTESFISPNAIFFQLSQKHKYTFSHSLLHLLYYSLSHIHTEICSLAFTYSSHGADFFTWDKHILQTAVCRPTWNACKVFNNILNSLILQITMIKYWSASAILQQDNNVSLIFKIHIAKKIINHCCCWIHMIMNVQIPRPNDQIKRIS